MIDKDTMKPFSQGIGPDSPLGGPLGSKTKSSAVASRVQGAIRHVQANGDTLAAHMSRLHRKLDDLVGQPEEPMMEDVDADTSGAFGELDRLLKSQSLLIDQLERLISAVEEL